MLQTIKFRAGEVASYEWAGYFASNTASLSEKAITTLICREMKWTVDEYESQPSWFIDYIRELLNAEAVAAKKQRDSVK